ATKGGSRRGGGVERRDKCESSDSGVAMAFPAIAHTNSQHAWKHRPPSDHRKVAPDTKRYFCGALMTEFGNSNKANLFQRLSDSRHECSPGNAFSGVGSNSGEILCQPRALVFLYLSSCRRAHVLAPA